jgi:2-hydroxymuconate-semialdehyde hydrolase
MPELRRYHVEVDGMRVHVAEAGEGPALLFLHGLSATHLNWELTMPAFADRWRVIAPDLPGHGDSSKPDAPYTIDFYAGVMRSLGRELGVTEAVVVGNSLGGQIAVELALSYPMWTRALALVAPAGGFGTATAALSWAIGAFAGPRVLRTALPMALERCVYDRALPECERRRDILAARLAHDDYPGFARAVSRSLVGAIRARQQPLGELGQPTLIVWGREDRLIGLSASRRLVDAVPHAHLVVLERCGHLPMIEQPERFNRALADFLRAVDAVPRRAARGVAEPV